MENEGRCQYQAHSEVKKHGEQRTVQSKRPSDVDYPEIDIKERCFSIVWIDDEEQVYTELEKNPTRHERTPGSSWPGQKRNGTHEKSGNPQRGSRL